MINITESARSKIAQLLAEENNNNLHVRAFVQGGGCSGFQYGFTFDADQAEDDFDVQGVLVDSMSMQYLQGATIDYTESDLGAEFKIINPNATTTCGCGSSFSV
ncbi:MAG TPA: iron-sulfur cluster insertion protein ErpA [Rheinheimera sp.]|nr:iron-sulfur cluster insertion protein ErpA [Rheinheimera sp.]